MYRLAIIGYGGMGDWHYKNISQRISNIEVVGAHDIRPEVQEKVESEGLRFYSTLEELLQDESIDIVTIVTPNNFHKDLAIKCMKYGKNVICEKPVTMNAAELEEIISAQKETGKLFSVHQNRRWDEDFVIVKKIQEQMTIGDFYTIETRVQGSRRAMHGWRGYKINGGGMLLDWGVHLLDQLLQLIPSPLTEVYGQTFSVYSEEVDDNVRVLMRFENGVSALLEVATNCFINQPRWHIVGTDGTAVINDWSCKGEIVRLSNEEEMVWDDEIVYTEAGPTRTMAPRPRETTERLELPKVTTHWTDYYQNIVDVLDGKAELIVKPEECLRVMKVIDLIFESAKSGQSKSCRI